MIESSAFPDYAGGGIVNLMQSIAVACGGRARYPQLGALPASDLGQARHVVLLVADGLGQSMLDTLPGTQNLRRHWRCSLSSVFPSTTATAITTFMSGLAPAQHGLTGWHVHLAEIGQTLAVLPLTPRHETARRRPEELPPLLFDYPTLYQQLGHECWVLAPTNIAGSPFNAWHARGANTRAYSGLPELFAQLGALLKDAAAPRFIYAYYPDLDSVAHRFGCSGERLQATLNDFDAAFGRFVESARGSDAWLIVTADHGFIDSPPEHVVCLDAHPQLAALLERPLCGERRAAFCYVAAQNHRAFALYVAKHLAHCVELRVSAELIDEGWFGPPPYHPRLAERIGDFALLMKDDWTIKDWLPGEKRFRMLGVHGGLSLQEMQVPLLSARL